MELLVPGGEAFGIAAARGDLGHRLGETIDVARRRVEHRQPRHVRLDADADLDQLERAGQLGDLLGAAGGEEVDEGAAADPPADQPLGLELVERRPHRGARGAEGAGQLALGRQLLAMAIAALDDRLAKLRRDPGRAAHRVGDHPDLAGEPGRARRRDQRPGLALRRGATTNFRHL